MFLFSKPLKKTGERKLINGGLRSSNIETIKKRMDWKKCKKKLNENSVKESIEESKQCNKKQLLIAERIKNKYVIFYKKLNIPPEESLSCWN